MNAEYTDYGFGITAIETGFIRPGLAACYLVESEGRAALIDTGTWHTVERILAVLAEKGIPVENVDYVAPTHVHLDHAGGAGELMQRFPNARLVVHPRGARHLIDPTKLKAGVIAVYGEEVYRRDYVELVPVDESRVVIAEDGLELMLAERKLVFMDTPGHANHHFCVWDEVSRGLFTGDTFGLSYREFDVDGSPFVMATTTPVQFNPDAWQLTLDRMMAKSPERMFLTHYGMVQDLDRLSRELRAMIERFAEIALGHAESDDRYLAIRSALRLELLRALEAHGVSLEQAWLDELIDMDLDLNTQGLMVWLDRQKAA